MDTTILSTFEAAANEYLDQIKSGDKLDRQTAVQAVTAMVPELPEQSGLALLTVVINARTDFEVTKGPKGGTFRK